MSVMIWRSSEVSSLSWAFSCIAWSWLSETWFSLSISWWFSALSRPTSDQSSSRCLCFLIRDRRADSLFDIILRCFLSFIILTCCSSASSEVELPVVWRLNSWTWGSSYKLLDTLLNWYAGVVLWNRPKWEGYWFKFEESRYSSCVNSAGSIFSTSIGLIGRQKLWIDWLCWSFQVSTRSWWWKAKKNQRDGLIYKVEKGIVAPIILF